MRAEKQAAEDAKRQAEDQERKRRAEEDAKRKQEVLRRQARPRTGPIAQEPEQPAPGLVSRRRRYPD